MSSRIEVPKPQTIDRSRLTYVKGGRPLLVKVPHPAKVDRNQLNYLFSGDSEEVGGIDIPMPAKIDVSKLVYTFGDREIVAPKPAVIDRNTLVYLSTGGVIRAPKARRINREELEYLPKKLTIIEQNVHSPVTPGQVNFPPFEVTPELDKKADERIAQYPDDQSRSAVLPLLHEVQHKFGFISPESIEWVAGKLDIAAIKVLEVVSFYPGFRQKAPGKFHVRVCRTLSCAMGGSYELMEKLCEITEIDRSKEDGHKDTISVSPCGNYSVEFAECLASCGTAPVCLVNDDFHEGVTEEKAQALLDSYTS